MYRGTTASRGHTLSSRIASRISSVLVDSRIRFSEPSLSGREAGVYANRGRLISLMPVNWATGRPRLVMMNSAPCSPSRRMRLLSLRSSRCGMVRGVEGLIGASVFGDCGVDSEGSDE